MKKSKIVFLILINIVWAVAALIYDIPAIAKVPIYFWPFIVICPAYPTLLAITWWQIYKNKKPNNYLLAFAAIPSAAYLIGALIFYPTTMILSGFSWLDFGQIFRVAVYGLQGAYLLKKYPIKKSPLILVTVFLIISFIIQYSTKTYNYINLSVLSDIISLIGYSSLVLMLFALLFKKLK